MGRELGVLLSESGNSVSRLLIRDVGRDSVGVVTVSERVRTRSQSSERENDQESSQPVGPAIVQQPTEEKRQGEEPPTETQGIAPSGEIKNEGAPAVQGPDVEAAEQDWALLTIEDEPGDGPDVKEGILLTFDPTKMLEAGMLFIKMQIIGFLFLQYYILCDIEAKLLLLEYNTSHIKIPLS
ncbi:putative G antigen family E member 3 [Aotus nancymaae]|uniref:putative G antigen family E member 3 n=1 Tax=Aotus nancymaae TaxID=37293 RepID=UPI0030FE3686